MYFASLVRGVYIQQNAIGLYSLDTFIHIMYILSDFQSIFVDSDVLYIIDLLTFSTNCFSWKFLSFFCLFFFSFLFKEKENFFRILFSTTIKSSSHNFARSFFFLLSGLFLTITHNNVNDNHDDTTSSKYVLFMCYEKKTGKKRQKWSVEKTLREQKKTLRHVKHIHGHIRTNTTVDSFWSLVYGFVRNVNIQNIEHHSPYWCVSVSISFRNSTTIALCQRFRTGAFKYSFTQTQFHDF